MLLAAWTQPDTHRNILEIGSGTGVISCILGQRLTVEFLQTIEIHPEASSLTKLNITKSLPHIQHHHFHGDWMNFLECSNKSFDLIVCNPPFFEHATGNPDKGKRMARHVENLSFVDLLKNTPKILNQGGTLAVVIPYTQYERYTDFIEQLGWYEKRVLIMRNSPGSPVKRIFLELCREDKTAKSSETLTIRNSDNTYSNEYLELVKGLYLFANSP